MYAHTQKFLRTCVLYMFQDTQAWIPGRVRYAFLNRSLALKQFVKHLKPSPSNTDASATRPVFLSKIGRICEIEFAFHMSLRSSIGLHGLQRTVVSSVNMVLERKFSFASGCARDFGGQQPVETFSSCRGVSFASCSLLPIIQLHLQFVTPTSARTHAPSNILLSSNRYSSTFAARYSFQTKIINLSTSRISFGGKRLSSVALETSQASSGLHLCSLASRG